MKHFRLNMQVLYDNLELKYRDIHLFPVNDSDSLTSFRLYQPGLLLKKDYVYLLRPADLYTIPDDLSGIAFIIHGYPADQLPAPLKSHSVIIIEDDIPDAQIITVIQEIFEKYKRWELELEFALSQPDPLDAMLRASLPILHNPIFIHDANFHILSSPRQVAGMPEWEIDPRSGKQMVSLQMLNNFMVDPDYLKTLNTHGPDLYPPNFRTYPILYINLWNKGHYEGRICVNELESAILPGDYLTIRLLAEFILDALNTKSLFWFGLGNYLEDFFKDFLLNRPMDPAQIENVLHTFDWKWDDRYLCLRLKSFDLNKDILTSKALIGHIEGQIPNAHALLHENGISVVINLSFAKLTRDTVISSLSVLIRESLLKMGSSNEISDFYQLPQGYYQAEMALELGEEADPTIWYHKFDDYILDYMVKRSSVHLSPALLCSQKVLLLQNYDKENNTQLYETLRSYLINERNVLQTAKDLFIHRSTLFYRLDRIKKVAEIDFDKPEERLLIRLSLHIMDHLSG